MVHVSSVCIFDCKWYVTILTTLKQFVSKSVKFVLCARIFYVDFSRVLWTVTEICGDLWRFVEFCEDSRRFAEIRGDSRIFAEFRGVS